LRLNLEGHGWTGVELRLLLSGVTETMAKIRAKNLKPKIQADFKRKKAKVGRKVERSNVTVIKVQSKHINIPIQAQMVAKKAATEQELAEKILKQLLHHNVTSQVASIEELRQFMEGSKNAASFIPMILPVSLELLFDEERLTRKAFLNFASFLFSKFSSQAFASLTPVIVSYMCGGLTSLLKGVRRDALLFLVALASSHSTILQEHVDKVQMIPTKTI
jgi:hypothetical protein